MMTERDRTVLEAIVKVGADGISTRMLARQLDLTPGQVGCAIDNLVRSQRITHRAEGTVMHWIAIQPRRGKRDHFVCPIEGCGGKTSGRTARENMHNHLIRVHSIQRTAAKELLRWSEVLGHPLAITDDLVPGKRICPVPGCLRFISRGKNGMQSHICIHHAGMSLRDQSVLLADWNGVTYPPIDPPECEGDECTIIPPSTSPYQIISSNRANHSKLDALCELATELEKIIRRHGYSAGVRMSCEPEATRMYLEVRA